MTLNEVTKAVAFRLGNVRGMDDAIQMEIGATIRRLENEDFHPWFLLSENNEFKTTAGENRVPVPNDFLAEYDDSCLYVKQDNGLYYPLQKMSAEEVRMEGQGGEGMPIMYALTNKYFRVFPVPDREYKLELLFYRRSGSILDGDASNPWFVEAPDLVIYETVSHIMLARKDKRVVQFEQLAAEQKQTLYRRHTAREEANRDVVMGG